ncbi:MAG: suppressor of fused domain protein [Planctomycetaceae bacterium]|nr:suppressor of fused domain protein [Planctomycetaceae bacterium]
MDYNSFYSKLFAPLETSIGAIDADTITAVIGFDAGGPPSFCTIGYDSTHPIKTYVTCELAVRAEQRPSHSGRYELLISCDDERWVRTVITDVARMACDVSFGDGHTLDIGPWVSDDARIQGVVFEGLYESLIDGVRYCVLRVIGVTRLELEFARETGVQQLFSKLKSGGVYPNTLVRRESVIGIR